MKTEEKYNAMNMDEALCPICGEYQMKHFGDYCPVCGWEHTPIAFIDEDFLGGANTLTANEFRKVFQQKRKEDPNYRWELDPKKYDIFKKPIKKNKIK